MSALADVFRGGPLFDYQQLPWDLDDPAGVVATTRRLRGAGLRPVDIAVGHTGRLLYFYDTSGSSGIINTARLADSESLRLKAPLKKDHIGPKYYFSYLGLVLDQLESARYEVVRADLDARHKGLTRKSAKRWRHRWQPHEARKFDEIPRRGIKAADALFAVEEDGYIDLRGVISTAWTRPAVYPLPEEPKRQTRFERVDFSFCETDFHWIDAHDCGFRAATMSCVNSRCTNCDFTMLDVAGPTIKS
jgi:hypothetical protein